MTVGWCRTDVELKFYLPNVSWEHVCKTGVLVIQTTQWKQWKKLSTTSVAANHLSGSSDGNSAWRFQKIMFSFRNSNCLLGWECSLLGIYFSSGADWHIANANQKPAINMLLSCCFFLCQWAFAWTCGWTGRLSVWKRRLPFPSMIRVSHKNPTDQSSNCSVRKLKTYRLTKSIHWPTCLFFSCCLRYKW